MNEPNAPEGTPELPALRDSAAGVDLAVTVAAIKVLLSSEQVTDAADKRILDAAASFLASRTGAEDISDITKHASDVAEVMGGYDMQGRDVPPEIDAVYLQIIRIQCTWYIDAVEAELRQSSPDPHKMRHPMAMALDVAKVLEKGYKDGALLREVQGLQVRIDAL